MAKNKTSETELSVEEYISKIDDEIKRDDAIAPREYLHKRNWI